MKAAKTAPTLFSILLRNTLGAFGVFTLVFLFVFSAGFLYTRYQMQKEAGQRIAILLGNQLDLLVDRGGKIQGEVVNRVLMNVLDRSVFILVFQANGTLVFWSWQGHHWYQEDAPEEKVPGGLAAGDILTRLPAEERPTPPETLFEKLKREGKIHPLVVGNATVGGYYAGNHPLQAVDESFRFLRNLFAALVGGLVIAGLIATLFAWSAFRRSAKQAERVQAGLLKIAEGRRNVTIDSAGSRELQGIATSALKLQDVLVREQALRRRWAQDIAHDLKTPLAGLRVQLDGLADGVLEPDEARLRLLRGEVDRLEALTDDLLVLSRLESPELTLVRRRFPLEDLTVPLEEHFLPLARQRGREWVWSTFDGDFFADPELLYRALANLLLNAVEHACGPGQLQAEWSADPWGFRAIISNPGHLKPEDEDYLFQRLHRGEASRTGRGNGLGLAIAQTIAQLHGGTLTLRNSDERVEARLILPAAPL